MPSAKPRHRRKTELSHDEYKERTYIAASRRTDRDLQARIQSALIASKIHEKRTGRPFRITDTIVQNGDGYDEKGTLPGFAMKAADEWKENEINKIFACTFPGASVQAQKIRYGADSHRQRDGASQSPQTPFAGSFSPNYTEIVTQCWHIHELLCGEQCLCLDSERLSSGGVENEMQELPSLVSTTELPPPANIPDDITDYEHFCLWQLNHGDSSIPLCDGSDVSPRVSLLSPEARKHDIIMTHQLDTIVGTEEEREIMAGRDLRTSKLKGNSTEDSSRGAVFGTQDDYVSKLHGNIPRTDSNHSDDSMHCITSQKSGNPGSETALENLRTLGERLQGVAKHPLRAGEDS